MNKLMIRNVYSFYYHKYLIVLKNMILNSVKKGTRNFAKSFNKTIIKFMK